MGKTPRQQPAVPPPVVPVPIDPPIPDPPPETRVLGDIPLLHASASHFGAEQMAMAAASNLSHAEEQTELVIGSARSTPHYITVQGQLRSLLNEDFLTLYPGAHRPSSQRWRSGSKPRHLFGFKNVNGHYRGGMNHDGTYQVNHPGSSVLAFALDQETVFLQRLTPGTSIDLEHYANHRDFWKKSGFYRSAMFYANFEDAGNIVVRSSTEGFRWAVTSTLPKQSLAKSQEGIQQYEPIIPLALTQPYEERSNLIDYLAAYFQKVPLKKKDDGTAAIVGNVGSFPVVEAITNLDPRSLVIWASDVRFNVINIRDSLEFTEDISDEGANNFRTHPLWGWYEHHIAHDLYYVVVFAPQITHDKNHKDRMLGQDRIYDNPLYYRTIMSAHSPVLQSGRPRAIQVENRALTSASFGPDLFSTTDTVTLDPVWYRLPANRALVIPFQDAQFFGYKGEVDLHNQDVV